MEKQSKRTILLVDDEPDSLEPISILLEQEYHVLTAESGQAALDLMESAAPEVIIADQRMPGMTGVELLAHMRERYPEIVRLILTAYTDFDAMLKAINEGRVYRYIIKPWDPVDMMLVIRQAVDWKDLREAQGRLAADLAEAHRALVLRNKELVEARATILAQEKLAAVGRFAAEMTHEISNHIQLVESVNHKLVKSTKEERRLLEELLAQTETLRGIASDIKDFAWGEETPHAPTPTDPLQPLREVLRSCSHHAAFKAITLRQEAEELPAWRLDPRQLKRLLYNLLKNAAKASPEGGEILVRAAVEAGSLVLCVIDHGRGIPAEAKSRIWEPFYTTGAQDGTGLGLTISRQIAALHGGTITCDDTPGGGATFTVRIPGKKAG